MDFSVELYKNIIDALMNIVCDNNNYDVYYVETMEYNNDSGDFDNPYYSYQVVIDDPKLVNYLNHNNHFKRYLGLDNEQVTFHSVFNDSLNWIKM